MQAQRKSIAPDSKTIITEQAERQSKTPDV